MPPTPVVDLCSSEEEDSINKTLASNNPPKDACGKRTLSLYHDSEKSANIADASNKRQKTIPLSTSVDTAHAYGIDTKLSCKPPVRLVVIESERGGTSPVITEGMFQALQSISNRVACCAWRKSASSMELFHIQQKDKWSCGYRNAQMLLVTILPRLSETHSYYNEHAYDPLIAQIPSLHSIQQGLQDSWRLGFDPSAASHFQNSIVGTRGKIGALEVSSLLAHWRLDAVVVQFITCRESRERLGPFCSAYFTKLHGGCPLCSSEPARQIARNIVDGHYRKSSPCACPLLPLYLQWEGHSVTAIGYFDSKLLILDPLKQGREILSNLDQGKMSLLSLSLDKVMRKDCQIVLAASRSISPEDRFTRRQHLNVVTAAEDAVLRSRQQLLPR